VSGEACGTLEPVPRDPAAIAAAVAEMLAGEALPEHIEAEIIGRAIAALILGASSPTAYLSVTAQAVRRELTAAAGLAFNGRIDRHARMVAVIAGAAACERCRGTGFEPPPGGR
jgi:hypothetical protein